jgi:hypothetical protein
MIKRAPRPDSGFLMIRNDVVRDKRLSYRARGLLCAMLSYPDNWNFNRDWLAEQSEGEGQRAVRGALQELEHYGYLRRERIKLDKGRFGWEHVVYDTPQAADGVFAGRTSGQFCTDGEPPGGNRPSQEVLVTKTVEEDVHELSSPHSGRFAPSVGAHEIRDQKSKDEGADPWATVPAQRAPEPEPEFDNWRDADRELFRSLVGEKLKSDGSRWGKGEWPVGQFYQAYRKSDQKRLNWPGRYLQSMLDRGNECGVEDWMIDQGLEAVKRT